ncbi:ferredoxin--NADP reductase [Sulfitobacter sp. KE29]|uniref:ferredoxin--NADP reductase n=1 Tax=unclassified Sulfitobacter TaxID=196795 RepID=UPI000C57B898|nr:MULTISPECIES: ferredoxin--NADP reductase [unclassified Sulfitobacter]MBM84429.1 ketosteroid-9-alpha-hydroxylase [Rhodospirillaceae bacterium]MDF3417326.1 ferredoxin--NADP reductase [Sulfitobacter sp. Ks38]MDF3424808.1 ferredoxin--NADP reductase [Sulfitobacter sp. KE29]MDF3428388.1 ferredoxin--NADP reductase [Sulfitobacter sp. S46]MDF3443160.1 ferredoxin--NADP reductase [Sulfitobacter sp. KE31]
MKRDFHKITVSDTREEIGGMAKSVMFEVPEPLAATFKWRAGQHLTLRFTIGGEDVRRSYSISSSPVSGNPLRITVKRVNGGVVSNHINDTVKAGDVIDVMPPFGGFCLDTGATKRRTHYFFGAGSGITPLHAMLHSVMVAEPHSVAHLAYGNANADSILLNDSFEALLQQHPGRLSVHHVLSAPSMWSGFSYWRKGIVDKAAIAALIKENPPYAQDAQYYICGPGGMNKDVKAALMSMDVPASRIHMESYGGAVDLDNSIKGIAATATIKMGGTDHAVRIAEGQTVLDAVRASGLKPSFSCQSGVCGACRAQLTSGEVHMRARMALEDDDIRKGAVLTCQSVAASAKITIDYDA